MTRSNKARTSVLIAIAASVIAFSAPAFANDDNQLPQGQMNVAGIDFTSVKAVGHLKSHLRRVAIQICMADSAPGALPNTDERKCVDTAVADGLAQIDSRYQQAMRNTSVDVASAQTDTLPPAFRQAH